MKDGKEVSLLIILRLFDFHSTLTFMGKYGVYGTFRESNIIFWLLYDILQNHIIVHNLEDILIPFESSI